MIAEGVRETDLADYQRAVRTLLVHPLVTPTHPFRGALAMVRRFSATLASDLDAVAGYRLEVGASCARLVRRVDRLDDTQAVRRRDRRPFDRRRYAYLCLVLAALGRSGTQVALTELADALKRRAAEVAGLGFDPDTYRHRLAFVDVVRHLLERGALSEVEASTVEWVRDPDAGEALYDVDRDVVHLLFVPPRVIQHVGSVRSLLATGQAASRDTRRVATRQRLARLLLEHPVVEVDDLDGAERTYLTSQAASLGEELQRLTGGQIDQRERFLQRPALPGRGHAGAGGAAAGRRDEPRGHGRGRPDRHRAAGRRPGGGAGRAPGRGSAHPGHRPGRHRGGRRGAGRRRRGDRG